MVLLKKVRKELHVLGDPNRAEVLRGFFKTKKGEYGYGDRFLGIKVPEIRSLAKIYGEQLSFKEIAKLLSSSWHEERMLALLWLVLRYKNSDKAGKKKIYNFYLENILQVNNWDLVDLSAPYILGHYLF